MPSQWRNVIFDMDGTLTLAIHDFDLIRSQLDLPEGVPILEAIEALPAHIAAQKTLKLDQIEALIAQRATAQSGATALLAYLQEHNYRIGIVTRNSYRLARTTLQAAGLSDWFAHADIIGREHCAPKPDPAGLHQLLQRWGAQAAQTLMVGDHYFDLKAGRTAGATTVHLCADNQPTWPDYTDIPIQRLDQLIAQL